MRRLPFSCKALLAFSLSFLRSSDKRSNLFNGDDDDIANNEEEDDDDDGGKFNDISCIFMLFIFIL